MRKLFSFIFCIILCLSSFVKTVSSEERTKYKFKDIYKQYNERGIPEKEIIKAKLIGLDVIPGELEFDADRLNKLNVIIKKGTLLAKELNWQVWRSIQVVYIDDEKGIIRLWKDGYLTIYNKNGNVTYKVKELYMNDFMYIAGEERGAKYKKD